MVEVGGCTRWPTGLLLFFLSVANKKKSRRHLSGNLLANGRPSSKLLCVLRKRLNIPSSSGLSLSPQHAQVGLTAEEGPLKKIITSALLLLLLPLHRCTPLVRTWPSTAPLPPGKIHSSPVCLQQVSLYLHQTRCSVIIFLFQTKHLFNLLQIPPMWDK